MTDIVERLSLCAAIDGNMGQQEHAKLFCDAADEIERLRERLESFELALSQIEYHGLNQDMNHDTFRIKAIECVRHYLEGKAPAGELQCLRAERDRLREALRRYGDRSRMCWAPAELQQVIDDALSETENSNG